MISYFRTVRSKAERHVGPLRIPPAFKQSFPVESTICEVPGESGIGGGMMDDATAADTNRKAVQDSIMDITSGAC